MGQVKFLIILFLTILLFSGIGFSQEVGDYGSVATGNWITTSTWMKWDGTGWNTAVTSQPSASDNVWIRGGFTVTVEASGKNCKNLFIESGSTLKADQNQPTTNIRYVRVAGTTVTNNGLIGNADDSLNVISFEALKNLTFQGTGVSRICRIRPRTDSTNVSITFDQDVLMTYMGSSGTGGVGFYASNSAGNDNITYTINAGRTVTCVNYCYVAIGSSGTGDGTAATTFNIIGTLILTGPNTNMNLRSSKVCTLNIGASGSLITGRNLNTVSSGGIVPVINVNGIMTVESGTCDLSAPTSLISGTGTFNLPADAAISIGHPDGISASGPTGAVQTTVRNFNTGADYSYVGTSSQVTGTGLPSTIADLTIDNSFGLSLTNSVTIDSTLGLLSGNITTGSNELIIGPFGSVSRTAGHVVGNFKKQIPLGAVSKYFEIGDASYYTPVDVEFGNVTTAGYLTAATTSSEHPQITTSGINENKSVNRYYTLTNSGIVFDNYSTTFNFDANDIDVGANPSNFIAKKYDAPNWSSTTTGVRTDSSIQVTGLTSFSDFAIGEKVIIISAQTGNWSSSTTWVGGAVPIATDDVVIANGHTVSLDGANSWTIASLTIGQDTSGVLNYAADVTAVNSLTINGDLILAAGSQFVLGSLPSVEPSLFINGNISVGNGAKLDLGSGSSKGVKTNFTKSTAGDQTISHTGTPLLMQFNKVIVNRQSTTERVVCSSTTYLKGGNLAILLTNGIWEQTAGTLIDTAATTANVNLGTANGTLKVTGEGSFWCTSSIVGENGSNGSDATIVINTSGTFTTGGKNSQARLQNSNTLDIISGTVNIYGRFTISNICNISGGNINIDPQGPVGSPLGNTSNPFEVTSAGTLNMSGGIITIVDPIQATGSGLEVKMSTSATYNITGGTIRLGDGVSTTTGADGFQVSTHSVPLWNLEINGDNDIPGRAITLTDNSAARNLVVQNNLTINSGTLNANYGTGTGSNITLGGTFTNNGTFNGSNAATYTFNGSAGQITNILPSTIGNLVLNNSNSISITNPVIVTGTLTLGGNNSYTNLSNVSGYTGLTYSATVPQTTGSELGSSITNLRINNENGVTLGNSTTVNGTFTLSLGNLITGANELIISETGSVSRTSGHIVGNFKKHIPLGAASKTFEIGDATYYTPVSVAFGDVTTAGYFSAKTTAADHPQIATSGLYSDKNINRYYTLTNSGIVFDSCNATFNFVLDDVDPGANTTNFIVKKYETGAWTSPTTANPLDSSIQATGLISFGDFAVGEPVTVAAIRSNGTGGGLWSNTGTWQGGIVPTGSDSVVILGPDSVYLLSDASCSGLFIQAGGRFLLMDTLSVVNSTVFGTIIAESTTAGGVSSGAIIPSGEMIFGNGSLYRHAQSGGIIPLATWNPGSTCEITGHVSGSKPENPNQDFYHFIWNCPDQTSNVDMAWYNNTIGGDITIRNSGSARMQMTSPGAGTPNVITINGNINVEGGQFTSNGSSSAADITVHTYGNINVTGGNFSIARGSGPVVLWYLYGDFSMSNATTQNSNPAGAKFVFAKTGTQTLTLGAGNTLTSLPLEVSTGTSLNTGISVIRGSGIFTLNTGATLICAHESGLDSTLSNTGTITLSTGANYEFNGTLAQQTGSILPSSVNNLIINNSSGVALSKPTTVSSTLELSSGLLTLGSNNLALSETAVISGTPSSTNMIVLTGSGELRKVFTDTTSFTFPVGDNTGTAEYSPVTLHFTSGTFSSAYAGVNVINEKHPNAVGIDDYLNRYWKINSTGISNFQCNVRMNYVDADINGIETNLYTGLWNNTEWTYFDIADHINNRLTGTVTVFGDFTGLEQLGPAGFLLSTNNIGFGRFPVGMTKIDSVKVINSGVGELIISNVVSDITEFSVSPTSGNIQPSDSMMFYISFIPISMGVKSGNIIFTHNAPSLIDTATVTGTGVIAETIAAVRVDANGDFQPDRLNDTVSVIGVVNSVNFTASANRFSYYIQDTTGGINITKGSVPGGGPIYNVGSELVVTGIVGYFRGSTQLTIIDLSTDVHLISTGNPVVPEVVTIEEYLADAEGYEGTFIEIKYVAKKEGSVAWPSNSDANMTIWDGYHSLILRIDADTDLDNNPEPTYPVNIKGVATQYTSSSGVHNDGYQISPNFYVDLTQGVSAPPNKYFTLISPADGSRVVLDDTAQTIRFDWNAAVDLNGDPLVYQWLPISFTPITTGNNGLDTFLVLTGKAMLIYLGVADSIVLYWTVAVNDPTNPVVYNSDTLSLKVVRGDIVGVNEEMLIPKEFALYQNYPNPFNPSTTIKYALPKESHVTLTVYNIIGQQVVELINENKKAGYHQIEFNAGNLPSGIYYYQIIAGEYIKTNKLMLIK